jgi:hypothetical protein
MTSSTRSEVRTKSPRMEKDGTPLDSRPVRLCSPAWSCRGGGGLDDRSRHSLEFGCDYSRQQSDLHRKADHLVQDGEAVRAK